jgi:hypothetical protein
VYDRSLTEHHPFTRLMVDLHPAEVSIWVFAPMTTVAPVHARRAFRVRCTPDQPLGLTPAGGGASPDLGGKVERVEALAPDQARSHGPGAHAGRDRQLAARGDGGGKARDMSIVFLAIRRRDRASANVYEERHYTERPS